MVVDHSWVNLFDIFTLSISKYEYKYLDSAFIGHVRKFQGLKRIPDDIENQLRIIEDLSNPKAKTYESNLSHQTVRYELVEKDEAELRNKYFENLIFFRTINDRLQLLLK